jgi:hypothetical protein
MKIRFLTTSEFCLKFKIMVEFEIEIKKKKTEMGPKLHLGPIFPPGPRLNRTSLAHQRPYLFL